MKNYLKYLNLSVAFLLITSCNSLTYLPADEYEKFTVKANEVFYNNHAVAKIGPMEYEYIFFHDCTKRQFWSCGNT